MRTATTLYLIEDDNGGKHDVYLSEAVVVQFLANYKAKKLKIKFKCIIVLSISMYNWFVTAWKRVYFNETIICNLN